MSLSREEIEFLQNHLEQTRKQGSRERRKQARAPITTDSHVLVVRSRTTGGPVYHADSNGKPACGMGPDKTFREMDPETAEQWHDPCQWCYPEEDEQ